MKAGLSVLFVDFGDRETAMRLCLQGAISKPRVNPSRLLGSPGINSTTKVRNSGPSFQETGLPSQPLLGFLGAERV